MVIQEGYPIGIKKIDGMCGKLNKRQNDHLSKVPKKAGSILTKFLLSIVSRLKYIFKVDSFIIA